MADRQDKLGGAPAMGRSAIIPAHRYTTLPPVIRKRQESMVDWFHRELKEGNQLSEYLRREKGSGLSRRLRLARKYRNLEQNKKSDLRRRLVLPAREFMRLKMMDPHFFEDENNIKKLIADNPEIAPWKN